MLRRLNPYGAPPPGNSPPGYGQQGGGYGPPPGAGYGGPPQGNFGPPQGPPPKKGMSGCLLAFLIVLGLFVVGGVVVGILVYRALGGFVGAAKDAMVEVQNSEKAPGTKQIRELGCDQAMVMDGKRLLAIGQRFEDEVAKKQDRAPKKLESSSVQNYVYCKKAFGTAPTCDTVAETYVSAVTPSEPFVVSVMVSNQTSCSGSYSAAGKKTGAATAPSIPGQE